jgi:hypothetical protein
LIGVGVAAVVCLLAITVAIYMGSQAVSDILDEGDAENWMPEESTTQLFGEDDSEIDVFSYIKRNTTRNGVNQDDPNGLTYLYRRILDNSESYCGEFQNEDDGFVGAGATLDAIQNDPAFSAAYDDSAGRLAATSRAALGGIVADGSTIAEVCLVNGTLYLSTVAPDEQTVTPFSFDENDARFYAFDRIFDANRLPPNYVRCGTGVFDVWYGRIWRRRGLGDVHFGRNISLGRFDRALFTF